MKKIIITLFISLIISLNLFSKEIEILSDIPGEGIKIKNHYKVHVNYRGILEDGSEFDSNLKRNEPFVFQIGLRQVILGWEKGIINMRVGGKRTIKIPPNLAYGARGVGKLIPPNAVLIFEIEIIDAFKPGYVKLYSEDLINKKNEGLILIDIRSSNERKKTGVLEGSLEIEAFNSLGNFNTNFIKSYQEKATINDHVVFISNDGDISSILANGFVEKLGSKNMYTLVGGIQNWIKEKRNLVKSSSNLK
jgi:rhodanese-related sulfurtransferase